VPSLEFWFVERDLILPELTWFELAGGLTDWEEDIVFFMGWDLSFSGSTRCLVLISREFFDVFKFIALILDNNASSYEESESSSELVSKYIGLV
jgi:hypothetical protein